MTETPPPTDPAGAVREGLRAREAARGRRGPGRQGPGRAERGPRRGPQSSRGPGALRGQRAGGHDQRPAGAGRAGDRPERHARRLLRWCRGCRGCRGRGQAAGQAVNIPPVVSLNGQVVSGGPAGRPLRDPRSRRRRPCAQLARAARTRGPVRGPVRFAVDHPSGGRLAASFAQPGQAQRCYSSTPGEITSTGSKALAWLAGALVVIG